MATTVGSLLLTHQRRLGQPFAGYRHDALALFDDNCNLLASFPHGTALDIAMASAQYHDSGDSDDLFALLRLEARDGNADAAAVVARERALG